MDKKGLKTGWGAGQPKEKRESESLVGAKNRGPGEPTYLKKRKPID